ncbi:MAG: type IV secretory system conjugative DNA transfer family protein [Deltaproteobacteria bacterium]|nr:type IV secretory system conjugative DNA transfer family protein [Deltaproteobacteria bacterium]
MARARFMSKWDVPQILNKIEEGMRFAPGRFLNVANSCKNAVIVGTVGSGKSSTQIIPNLLEVDANFVVTDLAGELFMKTSGWLESQGYTVYKLDFENPQNSHGFNPLLRNRGDHHALQRMASSIVDHAYPKEQSFWTSDAKALINIVFRALANYMVEELNEEGEVIEVLAKDYVNFSNAEYLCNGVGHKPVNDFVAEHLDDDQLFAKYRSICNYGDNQRSGVTATASAALAPFNDPATARIICHDDLDLSKFDQGKAVLYICVPENKQAYYSLIISLIAEAIFDALMARPVEGSDAYKGLRFTLLALDEFGQLYLPTFPTVCTTLRKRKCGILIALQDFGQLTDKYGQAAARTMLSGGLVSKLVLPGLGVETCEAVSRSLGHATVYDKKTGRSVSEPLMHPDEIRMLEQNQAVLIHGNKLPIRLQNVLPYFQEAKLKERSEMVPAAIEAEEHEPKLLKLGP